MLWILLGGFGGLAVVSVAAWARASKRRVELAEQQRREQQRLKFQEEALLSRMKAEKRDGED